MLYPNTWVAFDDYDDQEGTGVLVAMFDNRSDLRKYLLDFKERNNRFLEYFPTTEEGEYNFLCQL